MSAASSLASAAGPTLALGLPTVGTPTSTAEASALVRDAAAAGTRLRLVGRGRWLDAGHPVRADGVLALAALDGVVDHVPGDLTLTARAGTPLAEIARVAAAERQFLALDPFGAADGTLGATVATASAGPLAHAFGTPRSNVLGVEFVTGTGEVVRAGGRVVKNVAGFDLVRLATGAWGTLGVLTEVSVRLRALPEVDVTVAVALPAAAAAAAGAGAHGAVAALDAWLARLRRAPLAAWALELVNGPLAEALRVADRPVLLARLAGNAPAVAAQRATLAALGEVTDLPADLWRRLAACEPPVAAVARLSARPTRLATLCAELFSPAARAFGLLAHASPSRGVVRFVLPGAQGFGMPSAAPGRRPGAAGDAAAVDPPPTCIVERLPAALWASVAAPWRTPRAVDALARGARRAFDPAGILNAGILGDESAPHPAAPRPQRDTSP